MTPLAAAVARRHPELSEEIVQAVVKTASKELWNLALTRCIKYRDQGDTARWGALRRFANDVFTEGCAA